MRSEQNRDGDGILIFLAGTVFASLEAASRLFDVSVLVVGQVDEKAAAKMYAIRGHEYLSRVLPARIPARSNVLQ
jgi:hypothetical protein